MAEARNSDGSVYGGCARSGSSARFGANAQTGDRQQRARKQLG
jgi:hypothetical protein